MKNARRRRLIEETENIPPIETTAEIKKPDSWKWTIGALIVSVLVSFCLYGNSLHGQFVYDDSYFSLRKDLRDITSLIKVWTQPILPDDLVSGGGFYRPLWVASMALNFILFGTNPLSFHVVNVVLYAFVIFLVFLVGKRLTDDYGIAAAAALFFAFLPVHTEVVANIKSRDELLSALFLLIAWYVFLGFQQAQKKRGLYLWLSAGIFFAAILSKENVVFMPFMFFLVWYLDKKPTAMQMFLSFIPYFLVLFVYIILRLWALAGFAFTADNAYFIMNQLQNVSVFTRISTGFELVWLYILKIFVPYNLSASYDYNVIPTVTHPFANAMSILGIVMVLIIFGLAVYRSTPRLVRIGILFFIFSYAVISKVFYAKGAIFGERLIFLSSVGVALAVGYAVSRIIRWNRNAGMVLFAACLLIYAAVTIPRNLVWKDPETFFEHMAVDAPNSVQARTALARGYFSKGKLKASYAQAMAGYAIYPEHPGLLNVLGKLAYIQKDYSSAEHFFTGAIKYEPNNFEHHQFFALTLAKEGKFSEAMRHVESEFNKNPDREELRFIMALGLYRTGHKKEALSDKYVWTSELDSSGREKVLREF